MTIETLLAAVPPPVAPFEAFAGPWEAVEAEVGTALPPDYKDFVRLYGSGHFMEFLGVSVPRSLNPNVRLESYVPKTCEALCGADGLTYPLWPNAEGLLPFGATDDGDQLFWLPRGTPPNWGVVVWYRGLFEVENFDCDMTNFLAGLATGDVVPRDFPSDLRTCEHLFRSDARHLRYQLRWKAKPGGSMGFLK
jgi:hypothetical protein